MTVTVKSKTTLTVPPQVQRQAGIKAGDRVEFKVSGGIINIIPELPSAEDELTPAQRRIIDAQLAEGLDDIAKGRVSPKFATVDEMLASLKSKVPRKAAPRQKMPRTR